MRALQGGLESRGAIGRAAAPLGLRLRNTEPFRGSFIMTVRPNSIASRDVAYVVHAYTNLRRDAETILIWIASRRDVD